MWLDVDFLVLFGMMFIRRSDDYDSKLRMLEAVFFLQQSGRFGEFGIKITGYHGLRASRYRESGFDIDCHFEI